MRTYCQQLADMEYLYAVSGNNGKRFVYELAFYSDDEEEASGLRGLVSVEQLTEQLKENGSGVAAAVAPSGSVPRAAASGPERANFAVEKATLR